MKVCSEILKEVREQLSRDFSADPDKRVLQAECQIALGLISSDVQFLEDAHEIMEAERSNIMDLREALVEAVAASGYSGWARELIEKMFPGAKVAWIALRFWLPLAKITGDLKDFERAIQTCDHETSWTYASALLEIGKCLVAAGHHEKARDMAYTRTDAFGSDWVFNDFQMKMLTFIAEQSGEDNDFQEAYDRALSYCTEQRVRAISLIAMAHARVKRR